MRWSSSREERARLPRASSGRRDPVRKLTRFLIDEGIATEAEIAKWQEEIDAEVTEAADRALAADLPQPESAFDYVYSPDVDPTSPAFETAPAFPPGTAPTTMV